MENPPPKLEITRETKISTHILERFADYREQIEKVLCLPEFLTVTVGWDIDSVACPSCDADKILPIMMVQYKGRATSLLGIQLSEMSYPVFDKHPVHETDDSDDGISIPKPPDAYVCKAAFVLPSGHELQINSIPCTFGDIIEKLQEYEEFIVEYSEIDKRFKGDIYSMMKYIKALETQGAKIEAGIKETKDQLTLIQYTAEGAYKYIAALKHDAFIERTQEQTDNLHTVISHINYSLVKVSNTASKTWHSLLPYSDLWDPYVSPDSNKK